MMKNWSHWYDWESKHSLLIVADDAYLKCAIILDAKKPTGDEPLPECELFVEAVEGFLMTQADDREFKEPDRRLSYCGMELLRRYVCIIKNDIFFTGSPSVSELLTCRRDF